MKAVTVARKGREDHLRRSHNLFPFFLCQGKKARNPEDIRCSAKKGSFNWIFFRKREITYSFPIRFFISAADLFFNFTPGLARETPLRQFDFTKGECRNHFQGSAEDLKGGMSPVCLFHRAKGKSQNGLRRGGEVCHVSGKVKIAQHAYNTKTQIGGCTKRRRYLRIQTHSLICTI